MNQSTPPIRRRPSFCVVHDENCGRPSANGRGSTSTRFDQALDELIDRCRDLKLRLRFAERETRRHALVMLTVQTMNYLLTKNHRVVL